jgi:rod shape-determining protein MreC
VAGCGQPVRQPHRADRRKRKLKTEALLLQGRLQKLAALTEQNVRLRELLNSSALVNEKVEVAELIGMDPNPFTHRIIINKGERDGVVLGQPVLDARGLMGQVVELMPYTSRVLLLTDTTHSIPVQVNRNGLRAIASGTGNPERLELRHVADTADIKEGDLLVSSGMGQRFPAGYPVATVKEVIHDSGQPFAIVRAIPTAALNRSRYMLLVFSDGVPRRACQRCGHCPGSDRKGRARPGQPAAPATPPRQRRAACRASRSTGTCQQTAGPGPPNAPPCSTTGGNNGRHPRRNGWIVWLTFAIGLLLSVSPCRSSWKSSARCGWPCCWRSGLDLPQGRHGHRLVLGLAEDVLYGTCWGRTLILTLITFLVLSLQQRLRMFPMWQQSLVILVIFGLAQLVQLWLSALTGNRQPTLALVWSAVVSALLWPWISFALRGCADVCIFIDARRH